MTIYNLESYLRIIDVFDKEYKEILNEKRFVSKMKYALLFTTICVVILFILYLYFSTFCKNILTPIQYSQLFLACCITAGVLSLVYMQKVRNKMYQSYSIDLETPLRCNFQKKAIKSYNQVVADLFERKIIERGMLCNSKNDITLLNIYILYIEDEIKSKRKNSLLQSQKVTVILSLISLGIWFGKLIYSHLKMSVVSFEFLILVILTITSLWFLLYSLTQIYEFYNDILNRIVNRLEQISKILKSILIRRELDKNKELEELKQLSFFQKIKYKINKIFYF